MWKWSLRLDIDRYRWKWSPYIKLDIDRYRWKQSPYIRLDIDGTVEPIVRDIQHYSSVN